MHLVSKLTEHSDEEMVLIFDEPSKGLSQNILNLFMQTLREIVKDTNKTIILIEHNLYLLKNSDYIIDFGKRKLEPITELSVQANEEWYKHHMSQQKSYDGTIESRIDTSKFGIQHIYDNPTKTYKSYEHLFKGGVLKNLSSTAQWIYKDYNAEQVLPIVTIDFEGSLYSKNTLLFEVLGINSELLRLSGTDDVKSFDVLSSDNRCSSCKGSGQVETFDITAVLKDTTKAFGKGLLVDDVMVALKSYNMSKFTFFFKEIKKATGNDLAKAYKDMTEAEKNIFWYGYWEESFYDATKKTQRTWQGLIHLIKKYMRSSKSEYKARINDSKTKVTCPICEGTILNHNKPLAVGKCDLRNILTSTIKDSWSVLVKSELFNRIVNIIGNDVSLNADISELPREKQVALKALELEEASLYAYTIVLKNALPFWDAIQHNIETIAKYNEVICIDFKGVHETKEAILDLYFKSGKKKKTAFVYECFGFKKVSTEINAIRKKHACPICKGKGVLREESIFEGVDTTETPCTACHEMGISDKGLKEKVQDITVADWLFGTVSVIKPDIEANLGTLPLLSKIEDLDKYQLMALHEYDKE